MMRMRRTVEWARAAVRVALRAFPREFRRKHGADALEYFADRARERAGRGRLALLGLVLATVADTVAAGLAERRLARSRRARGPWLADVRYAARSLGRRPAFVAAAAVPVALGIAGVTAMIAVIDHVLVRPLPYDAAHALVVIGRPLEDGRIGTLSAANLVDLEETVPGLVSLGGATGGTLVVGGTADPIEVRVTRPTRGFMETLRVTPTLGRGFAPDEYTAPRVVLVTWAFWQRRWGGDPGVVGTALTTDMGTFEVIGVLPSTWTPPEAMGPATTGDVWIPLDYGAPMLAMTRAFGFASGIGRLAPGADIDAVNVQLGARAVALWRAHPEANAERDGSAKALAAQSLHTATVGPVGARLSLLLGAVAVLLLIACANVANLFLAEGTMRERELALRTVLGAGRRRLVTQLLAESVGVALVGGAVGLVLARFAVEPLVALTPGLPRAGTVSVDPRVALAALAVSLASGIGFGLAPAFAAAGRDPAEVLRGGRHARPGAERMRGLLVVGQTALALVLVTAGGLLAHSALRLVSVDPGYRAAGVLTLRPRLDPRIYGGAEDPATPFYERFTAALSAVPSVSEVSGTLFLPGEGEPAPARVRHPRTGEWLERARHTVLPGFFDLLGIPIRAGRALGPEDRAGGDRVAVIAEALARELFPEGDAVGRTFMAGLDRDEVTYRVVGMAADIRNRGPHHPAEPVFYESYLQNPWLPALSVLVRHDGDAAALMPAIREALRGADPSVPLSDVRSLDAVGAANTAEARQYAILLVTFALIALAIAGAGLYASLSFAVARRFRELGIRRAVGADTRDVLRLIIRRGMAQAGAGAVLGTLLALATTRVLAGLMFEITTFDPTTYVAVAGVLLAVALVACLTPARRTTRADPLVVLRAE